MPTFTGGPYRVARWAFAGAFLLVLLTAGCGGGALALDPVASAADRTLDKQTGRFAMTVTFDVPSVGRSTISGEGSFSDRAMQMTMDFPDFGQGSPSSLEFRLLYPVMYMHFDGLPSGVQLLPDGKTWVKVDLQRSLKKLGVNLAKLGGGESPTAALAQLRGSKDAKKLGTETVDGVQTTHYRVKVNLDAALARATPKQRQAVQQLLRAAREDGVDVTPTKVDVWIGDDGLVRRLTEKLGTVGTVTMTFSDYGAPVQIEAPPASETSDLSTLLPYG